MPKETKLTLPRGTKIPNHIAIIPDGNRRWARARGLYTLEGHRRGFEAAVKIARASREMGVNTATLWGFSTENWDRAEEEINYLMKLYEKLIDDYVKDADKDGVRIYHFGRRDRLPKSLLKKIDWAMERTAKNTKFIANICIDYGGHDDILRAVRSIVKDGIQAEDIDEKLFEKYIDTRNQPYPYVDLMIRTSGEQRTSGFMLWESSYTEYYWENDHFPDFTPEKLRAAILDYSRRRRRFGGNDAEAHLKFKPELTAKLEVKWWRLRKIPEGTKFGEYALQHLKEQYGLSKDLAKKAAIFMTQAVLEGNQKKWEKAKRPLKKFYELVRDELKLAFEPSLAASMEVKLWQEMNDRSSMDGATEVEDTARQYYAEVYRISLFQAAKAAHLRVLANVERNLAEAGMGEQHWAKAEDYLEKFYSALKERVA